MIIMRIVIAGILATLGFMVYPSYVTIISQIYDIAQTLNPSMTAFDNVFFEAMPLVVLLLIIFWAVNVKLLGGNNKLV